MYRCLNESRTKDMLLSLTPLGIELQPLLLNKDRLDRAKFSKVLGLNINFSLNGNLILTLSEVKGSVKTIHFGGCDLLEYQQLI